MMNDDEKLVDEFLSRIPRDTDKRRDWLMALIGRVRKQERQAKK